MKSKLFSGDNIESLKKLEDNSIDSVVTDPPYGLSFMGKKWDYDVPSVDFWKEVYRVLKPGGHILSFGGTRTYHRMTVNIEDAGFEIRDQIMWLYGSGFPKSHNIGKAVDKLEGNEREIVGDKPYKSINTKTTDIFMDDFSSKNRIQLQNTKGNSTWEGWGTGLKPANEPICLARKPLSEKTVAENVLRWGTGGVNVDGCRVGSDIIPSPQHKTKDFKSVRTAGEYNNTYKGEIIQNEGRFPANIILECLCDEVIKGEKGEVRKGHRDGFFNSNNVFEIKNDGKAERIVNYGDKGDTHTNPMCPCYILDEQSGVSKLSKGLMKSAKSGNSEGRYNWNNGEKNDFESVRGHDDKGGASRFFYQAKVSKAERNMGLDEFQQVDESKNKAYDVDGGRKSKYDLAVTKNNHPTVKPVSLMSYLCRLITPPGGIVLDPFMGSGSTGIAALLEDFSFIGMEMDEDYIKIAEARIKNYEEYRKLLKK